MGPDSRSKSSMPDGERPVERPTDSSSSDSKQTKPSKVKMLWLVFLLLVMNTVAFLFASHQKPSLPMWEPPGSRASEFLHPRETNRWQRSSPFITTNHLQSVALSSDGKSALAVGEDGTILKSSDAGQSWQSIASGSNAALRAIAFSPDGKIAFAVGDRGAILKSSDAGQSWQSIASGNKTMLNSLAFSLDGKSVLMLGGNGIVLKSGDSGQTWQSIVSGSSAVLSAIAFSNDGKNALVVGFGGTVLKSSDAGHSWQIIASGSNAELRSIAFSPDGKNALAVGHDGAVLKSSDSGQSWQSIASGSNASLISVAFSPDGKNALAVGHDGAVLKSSNSGQSWQSIASGSKAWLNSVALSFDGKSALSVGNSGIVLRSCDAGRSWQSIASGSQAWLNSVALSSDGKSALAVGNSGTVLRSSDAGRSWQNIASGDKAQLLSIALSPDGKSALVVGSGGTVLKSIDAGQSWKTISSGSKAWLISIAFSPDGKSALAAGAEGTILKSIDAGQSWQNIPSGSKEELSALALSPDGNGALAVGREGTILKSSDAGQSWKTIFSGSKAWLISIAISPDGNGALALRRDGAILKSDDTGQNWQRIASGGKAVLSALALSLDGKSALAVGNGGTILKSSDAGQSWQQVGSYSKDFAPWYLTGLPLLLAICMHIVWRLTIRSRIKPIIERLMNKGVTDNPTEDISQDKLAFAPVVEALSRFLRHSATNPPLSIAINAAWGMGKSSFMKMLAGSLRERGARPVWFNVWHHQHEPVLLAPLLQAITSQAIPSWWRAAGWRFRVRLWLARCQSGGVAFWLGSCALISIPAYLVLLAMRADSQTIAMPLAMMDRAVRDVYALAVLLTGGPWLASAKNGSLGDLASAALMALRSEPLNALIVLGVIMLIAAWLLLFSYALRPFPANPAILVASMEKRFSLSQAEAQTDFRQRFRRHFGQVTKALQPQTLVIFIDDLDRCKPDKAAELLEAVNYLNDAGPCFVILGIARDIVEAQVASAHELVAKEQAALRRLRIEAAPGDATNPDLDRLLYAQRYLRKLVQLDVNLPKLEAERSFSLLLGHVVSESTAPENNKNGWLKAVQERLPASLLALFLLGCAGLLIWRMLVTVESITENREAVTQNLEKRNLDIRNEIQEAKLYANWMLAYQSVPLQKPASLASTVPNPKVLAESVKENSSIDNAQRMPLYKTRTELAQTAVRDMETGIVLLEKEAREGQRKTYVALEKKLLTSSRKTLQGLMLSPQPNGITWIQIKTELETGTSLKNPTSTIELSANAQGRGFGDEKSTQLPVSKQEVQRTPWEYLILSMLPLLSLIWLIYRKKPDDYVVRSTPKYEGAIKVWQQELLRNPETASPREMKRFLNLSRYTIARLEVAAGIGNELAISEECVVELCAKWLGAQGVMSDQEMHVHLRKNGAKKEEVELFLQIAGQLTELSASKKRTPSPRNSGVKASEKRAE